MAVTYTIVDPFTGEDVIYVNPWTYDPARNAWVADDVRYVTGENFNNLLRFGQPFNPSNVYTGQFYIHEIEGLVPPDGPTVIFSQENVLTRGFGWNIDFDDFDLVKDLKSGVYSGQLQEGQVYTLSDLQALGISLPVIGENGQDYGDHALSTNLYGTGSVYPGASYPAEMAYIFGSLRVRISQDTTFRLVNGQLVIDGEIELFEDNFNHEGGLPPFISAIVQIGFGDVANFERVFILYEGEGAARRAVGILQGNECFAGGTPILLHGNAQKPIESITPGDIVLSYDPSGTLVPGRVTRTFRNEVSHILDVHGLKVTPGHATLCGAGMFKGRHVPIIDILLSDGALVQADGTLIRMAINAPVGSVADAFVKVAVAQKPEDMQAGRLIDAEMRVGTLLFDRDGTPISVLDCLTAEGYAFDPQTGLVAKPGEAPHPLFWFGRLPRPEDYILTRSQETLDGILTDGEWEGSQSELIAGRLLQTMAGRVN